MAEAAATAKMNGIPIEGAERMQQLYGDGWMNVFRGTGIAGKDPRVSTYFGAPSILPDQMLVDIYRGEGIGKRIVDLAANDMTREWFTVQGDTDGSVVKSLDDINARAAVQRSVKWARLYGGSVCVMGINDGGTLETPLNEATIKSIEFLKVYDKTLLSRKSTYNDPELSTYGKTELWQVNPTSGTPFVVHETRVLVFDGVDIPDYSRSQRDGWGDSVLQSTYSRLRGLCDSYAHVEQIIAEFIVGVLSFENLQELLADGNEDMIRRRLNIIDLSRNVLNTIAIDKDEDYKRIVANVGGIEKLLDKLEQALSTVSGYPTTLLFGSSPAGLSATGASDIRFYYDNIAGQQEMTLRQPSERLTFLTMKSSEGPTKGAEIPDWSIKFVPLWQPTEAEVIKMRKEQAETDERYINSNVLEPAEVAISRFGGDEYSVETTLREGRLAELESGTPTEQE